MVEYGGYIMTSGYSAVWCMVQYGGVWCKEEYGVRCSIVSCEVWCTVQYGVWCSVVYGVV